MRRFIILLLSMLVLVLPAITQAAPWSSQTGPIAASLLVPPHSWPAYRFSPGGANYNYYEHRLNASNVNSLTFHPLSVDGFSVIANGLAFSTTPYGVQAVRLASGEVQWTWPHPVGGFVTDGQRVYGSTNPACPPAAPASLHLWRPADCTMTDMVALDNQTGALQWDLTISPSLLCCEGLILAQGRLFFGVESAAGGTPSLEAVTTQNGQVAWRTPVVGLGPGVYGVYQGQAALYVISGALVQVLDPATGQVRGSDALPSGSGSPDDLMFGDGRLIVGTATRLMAFTSHGRRLWMRAKPFARDHDEALGAVGHGGLYTVFSGNYGAAINGYNDATGKTLWPLNQSSGCGPRDTFGGPFCTLPVVANGLLYVGGQDVSTTQGQGVLMIIDAHTGQQVASYESASLGADISPEVVDGVVYMFDGAGKGGYFSLN